MLHENDWDHIDDLVDAYAKAYVHGDDVPALQGKLIEACAGLTNSMPHFDDFTSLLDTTMRTKDAVSRKIAWTAQKMLGSRAWCVGQQLFLGRKYPSSPLVDQVAAVAGIKPANVDYEYWRSFYDNQSFQIQSKIDSLHVDFENSLLYVVKGVSFSQAKRLSKSLLIASGSDNLYAPTDRLIGNLYARPDVLGTLVAAHAVLKSAFPGLNIVPLYMVVDDVDAGWHFQAIDVRNLFMQKLINGKICLDEYSGYDNSLNEDYGLNVDSESLARLDLKQKQDPLDHAPVDRPTRSLMLLNALWKQQVGNRTELVPVPATELARAVEKRFGITYPENTRRHDLEDCLRGGGFVTKCRYSQNSFAITPVGVMRIYATERLFQHPASTDFSFKALLNIEMQARLLADYRNGNGSF